MKYILLMMLFLSICNVGFTHPENKEWKEYVKKETEHKRKIKELQAIHQVYADQILLAKTNISVENSSSSGSYSLNRNDINITNKIKNKHEEN